MPRVLSLVAVSALVGAALAALAATEPVPNAAPSGPSPAAALLIAGPLVVIDADTFDVGGIRVRLHGVDAPEAGQECRDAAGALRACGAWATAEAERRWGGREAACQGVEEDRYGRLVASCTMGGEDVGDALVASGTALAYRDYSLDHVAAEEAARAAGAGLWAGSFERPQDWRAARRAGATEGAGPAGTCAIKGNVSDSGRIYHLPGGPHYERTRIDERRGERWFCSEAEALAARWRPPR